jgi:hypothetical protein
MGSNTLAEAQRPQRKAKAFIDQILLPAGGLSRPLDKLFSQILGDLRGSA